MPITEEEQKEIAQRIRRSLPAEIVLAEETQEWIPPCIAVVYIALLAWFIQQLVVSDLNLFVRLY